MNQDDEQSFLSLVEHHKGIVYKVSDAYAKTKNDKKDLFQEIMLSLWKAYPSFKGNSKISTWVYKVSLYTAITNYRSEKKQIKYEQIYHDYTGASDSFSDDCDDQVKFLYEAVAKLSSVDKAIVLLLLEEKSYKEISQIIGLKPTAVAMRINRAKDKLMSLVTSIKT